MRKTPFFYIVVLISFLANTFGPIPLTQAQEFHLPAPGVRVELSPDFTPPMLKGIKVHPDNPFQFDFVLESGDKASSEDYLKQEAIRLIKYFLASLTIPEKDLWVNLSPYEKDRIIPQSFGQTEMGRDLLAEDYMLKQITASLIYPEGETGKKFWKRIYEEAQKKYGTTDIPVDTFNKVWIVPEKAVVYENAKAGTAYVVESKLKVMLEQDYLALVKNNVILSAAKDLKTPYDSSSLRGVPQNDVSTLGSQIIREIVIPELTKEVNEDKNFAQLRQVYSSLILATWYKKKIRDSILEQVYADKNKIAGVGYKNIPADDIEGIYQRYLQAFKKGVFNYIKEESDPVTQETVPRKYFSGGLALNMHAAMVVTSNRAMIGNNVSVRRFVVSAGVSAAGSLGGLLKLNQAMTSLEGKSLIYDPHARTLVIDDGNGGVLTLNAAGESEGNSDIFDLGDSIVRVKKLKSSQYGPEQMDAIRTLGRIGASPGLLLEQGMTKDGNSYLHVEKIVGESISDWLREKKTPLDMKQLEAVARLVDLFIEYKIFVGDFYNVSKTVLGRVRPRNSLGAFWVDFDLVKKQEAWNTADFINHYIAQINVPSSGWKEADPEGKITAYLQNRLQNIRLHSGGVMPSYADLLGQLRTLCEAQSPPLFQQAQIRGVIRSIQGFHNPDVEVLINAIKNSSGTLLVAFQGYLNWMGPKALRMVLIPLMDRLTIHDTDVVKMVSGVLENLDGHWLEDHRYVVRNEIGEVIATEDMTEDLKTAFDKLLPFSDWAMKTGQNDEDRILQVPFKAEQFKELFGRLSQALVTKGISFKRAINGISSNVNIEPDYGRSMALVRSKPGASQYETMILWSINQGKGVMFGYSDEKHPWLGYGFFTPRSRNSFNVRFQVFDELRGQGKGERMFSFLKTVLVNLYQARQMVFPLVDDYEKKENSDTRRGLEALGFKQGDRPNRLVYEISSRKSFAMLSRGQKEAMIGQMAEKLDLFEFTQYEIRISDIHFEMDNSGLFYITNTKSFSNFIPRIRELFKVCADFLANSDVFISVAELIDVFNEAVNMLPQGGKDKVMSDARLRLWEMGHKITEDLENANISWEDFFTYRNFRRAVNKKNSIIREVVQNALGRPIETLSPNENLIIDFKVEGRLLFQEWPGLKKNREEKERRAMIYMVDMFRRDHNFLDIFSDEMLDQIKMKRRVDLKKVTDKVMDKGADLLVELLDINPLFLPEYLNNTMPFKLELYDRIYRMQTVGINPSEEKPFFLAENDEKKLFLRDGDKTNIKVYIREKDGRLSLSSIENEQERQMDLSKKMSIGPFTIRVIKDRDGFKIINEGEGDLTVAFKDRAMILSGKVQHPDIHINRTGGIDLTPANMNLKSQNNGGMIKFHLDPAMLAQLKNAPGFVPFIISVKPLRDLRGFLGVQNDNVSPASGPL